MRWIASCVVALGLALAALPATAQMWMPRGKPVLIGPNGPVPLSPTPPQQQQQQQQQVQQPQSQQAQPQPQQSQPQQGQGQAQSQPQQQQAKGQARRTPVFCSFEPPPRMEGVTVIERDEFGGRAFCARSRDPWIDPDRPGLLARTLLWMLP